jgi:hypothetical protein
MYININKIMEDNSHLKYGTVVVVHNYTIFDTIYNTFFDTEKPGENSEFVVLFDNNQAVYCKNHIMDLNHIKFEELTYFTGVCPNEITKEGTSYFYRSPISVNSVLRLKIGPLFEKYLKYPKDYTTPSAYNCIYFKHHFDEKTEKFIQRNVFSIIKTSNGDKSDRYAFAYDPIEFENKDLLNIMKIIFYSQ